MSRRKTGVAAVVAAEVPAHPLVPGSDVEQLELANLVGLPELRSTSRLIPRRAGRPAGSPNKNTEIVRAWLLSQFGDPVARLAAMAAMPIAEIAERLKCDPLKAAELWRDLQKDVAEYTHQKMPAKVEVTDKRRVRIVRGESDESFEGTDVPGDDATIIDQSPPPPAAEEKGGGDG